MNTTIRHLSALALTVLPIAGTRAAFDPAIVPTEARWVVSLDLNAIRESNLGKEVIEAITIGSPRPAVVDLKLDVPKLLATIGTATAFGTNFSQNAKEMDGVLIVQGTADLRKIAEAYVAQATITTPNAIVQLKDLPFEAYSLHNEVIIGFPKEPIILVGRSVAQLTKALSVFRTHTGSIARTPSPLSVLLPTTGKSFLVAASVVPVADGLVPGDGPQARILQMANAGSLALGDDDKTTSAHLSLVSTNDEMADKLTKIVQGLVAMISLTETSDKQLAEFIQSVNVTRDGKTVSLHLAYPSEGIVRLVRNLRANMERGHANNSQAGRPEAEQAQPEVRGTVIAQWTADQAIGQPTPTAEALVTRTIEKVSLKNGTIIILTGRRNDGENARLDCVEIAPAAGGSPLVFEAENMKLTRYRAEALPFASRGKLILITGATGNARFEFPGADGSYTIKVRYVDESDGKSTFTVSTQEPDQAAGTE